MLHRAELDEPLRYLRIEPRQRPKYMLWLGAGASASSGVPLASDIVLELLWQEFDSKNHASPRRPEDIREWAKETYGWFAPEDPVRSEYSLVMEKLLKPRDIRKDYLISIFRQAVASEGYRILGRLIEIGIFDTILTTNFDNLVQQGAGAGHIVEVQPDQFEDMKPFPRLPRLVRLHGGFSQDLRNTTYELENTPASCFDAIRRMLRSYGLIVVGYGGRDATVMENLFLTIDPKRELNKGVFWCHRAGDPLSSHVERFINRHRQGEVALVEIIDFDHMMRRIGAQFNISGSHESDLENHLTNAWEDQALLLDLIKSVCRERNDRKARAVQLEMLSRLNWFCGGNRAILAICDDLDHCRIATSVGFDRTPPSSLEISPNEDLGRCLGRGDNHFRSPGGSEVDLGGVFGDSRYVEGFVVWHGESPRCVVVFGADQPFPERSQLQPIKAGVELLASLSSRPAERG